MFKHLRSRFHNFQTFREAIHIQWEKPTLNHQLYHVKLELFIVLFLLFVLFNEYFFIHYIQLYTLYKLELKMTEELSKHVFIKCRLLSCTCNCTCLELFALISSTF